MKRKINNRLRFLAGILIFTRLLATEIQAQVTSKNELQLPKADQPFWKSNEASSAYVSCKPAYKKLYPPATLITYGFMSPAQPTLKAFNHNVQHEVVEHLGSRTSIDDFHQFAPASAVYGLHFLGMRAHPIPRCFPLSTRKGKQGLEWLHNFNRNVITSKII